MSIPFFPGAFYFILAVSLVCGRAQAQPNNIVQPAATKKPGEIILEPVSASTPDGAVEFEFGTLYVPENRSDPKSRIIGVGFARFRALGETSAPPTFHLPGGPGNSLLTGLKNNPSRLKQIEFYRRVGDVVLVDQRGFSERGEVLRFKHR